MNRSKSQLKHSGPRIREFLCATVFLVGLSLAVAEPVATHAETVLDPHLEKAILAEDWEKVITLLPREAEPNLAAPLRLVKGHACLATNRNNESLCLFLGASSEVDLRNWEIWSNNFATKYPASPITHYFKGDSYARLKKWDQAISDFNTALQIDSNHSLVLNARGVAYANKNELAKARIDFQKAVLASDGQMSDAYANIGVLRIQKKTGIKGALGAFDKALEISPNFALALHGKACVKAANANEITEVEKKSLVAAVKDCPSESLKKLMIANAQRIQAFWEGCETEYFLAILGSGEEVGTTIDSTISHDDPFKGFKTDINNDGGHFEGWRNQHNFNSGFKTWTDMSPTEQQNTIKSLDSWAAGHPKRQDAINRCVGELDRWNEHGGPAQQFNQSLTEVGADSAAAIGMTDWELITKATGVAAGLTAVHGGNQLESIRNKYHEGINDFQSQFGKISPSTIDPVGGVDMNLADVHQGPGMWPFVGYYALGYDLAKFEQPFAYVHALDSSPTNEPMKTADRGTESPHSG